MNIDAELITHMAEKIAQRVSERVKEKVRAVLRQRQKLSQLLTREDVADILNVSLRTVDTLRATGELPPIKVGRNVRFHPDAVRAYIKRQAVDSTE